MHCFGLRPQLSRRLMVRTALVALLGCGAGYGSTIVTTPSGLAPGTQYQLVFVTADGFEATDPAISTYNSDVTAEAALDATLATFDAANGVTWTVIGSTTSVNADANAPSSGLVYTLNGTEVSSSGLYGGVSLLAPIDIDQNGSTLNTTTWTGSNTLGTAAGGINDLGQTFAEPGDSAVITTGWIDSPNGEFSDNFQSLYALSSVITVPGTSPVPEPGTVAWMPGAVLLLFGLSRLRRKVSNS